MDAISSQMHTEFYGGRGRERFSDSDLATDVPRKCVPDHVISVAATDRRDANRPFLISEQHGFILLLPATKFLYHSQ